VSLFALSSFASAACLTVSAHQHIKCDETRPQCGHCTTRRLQCPGYTKPLVWKTKVGRDPPSDATIAGPYIRYISEDSTQDPAQEGPVVAPQDPAQGDPVVTSHNPAQASPIVASQNPAQGSLAAQDQPGVQSSESVFSANEIAWILTSLQSQAPDLPEDALLGTADQAAPAVAEKHSGKPAYASPTQYATEMDQFSTIIWDDSNLDHYQISAPEPDWLVPPVVLNSTPVCIAKSTQSVECSFPLLANCTDMVAQGDDHDTSLLDDEDPDDSMGACTQANIQTLTRTADLGVSPQGTLGPLWIDSPWFCPPTSNDLTLHYFESVCQILSCYDSRENPFRSDIPRMMLTCDYVHHCVIAMSAAHLANTRSGMEGVAMKHQARAMAGLSNVIQALRVPEHAGSTTTASRYLCSPSARYQALLVALLLGISSVRTNDSSLMGDTC
jgi:hypothetical protein